MFAFPLLIYFLLENLQCLFHKDQQVGVLPLQESVVHRCSGTVHFAFSLLGAVKIRGSTIALWIIFPSMLSLSFCFYHVSSSFSDIPLFYHLSFLSFWTLLISISACCYMNTLLSLQHRFSIQNTAGWEMFRADLTASNPVSKDVPHFLPFYMSQCAKVAFTPSNTCLKPGSQNHFPVPSRLSALWKSMSLLPALRTSLKAIKLNDRAMLGP